MISLSSVTKHYNSGSNKVMALDDISLNISKGELCAIVGDSGSGKSTLMNILGCLDTPSSGSYKLSGREVSALSHKDLSDIRSREIGFIFQGFNLISNMNALENVTLPLMYLRIPPDKRATLAEEALCNVGLNARMKHLPSEMSGGQQQRVAIARALVTAPGLILADEPTGNLDPKSTKEILDLLLTANKNGCTVVLITHDRAIADLSNRTICISNGKIISDTIKEA